jgi:hypothetical protein
VTSTPTGTQLLMSSANDTSEEGHDATDYEFMFVHEGYTFKQCNGEDLRM